MYWNECRAIAGAQPLVRPVASEAGHAPGDVVVVRTREMLDHFAACPRCGYAIQASETITTFAKGGRHRILFRTCGLPCGWDETTVEVPDVSPARR